MGGPAGGRRGDWAGVAGAWVPLRGRAAPSDRPLPASGLGSPRSRRSPSEARPSPALDS